MSRALPSCYDDERQGDVRPIVCVIVRPWTPIKMELLLIHPAVLQSMKVHVHRFCVPRLDLAIYDLLRHQNVSLHESWRLRMPHLFENGAYFDGFVGVDVQCPEFGFCGR